VIKTCTGTLKELVKLLKKK
jgi:hypothetical protein